MCRGHVFSHLVKSHGRSWKVHYFLDTLIGRNVRSMTTTDNQLDVHTMDNQLDAKGLACVMRKLDSTSVLESRQMRHWYQ
jgi:hypothetical protein